MPKRSRITIRPSPELHEQILAEACHRNVAMSELLLGCYLFSIGEGPLDDCIARARAESLHREHLADIAALGGHAKAARFPR